MTGPSLFSQGFTLDRCGGLARRALREDRSLRCRKQAYCTTRRLLTYAAWLGTTASLLLPPVDLLDTTAVPPATTAEQIDVWLDRLLHR